MPSSFTGLVLFLALLTPGFVYTSARERQRPGQEYSTLRETAFVVTVSVISCTTTLFGYAGLRTLVNFDSPQLDRLFADSSSYANDHYAELFFWGTGLLLIATSLAFWVAQPLRPVAMFARSVGAALKLDSWTDWGKKQERQSIEHLSAWYVALNEFPELRKFVGLRLKDGTYIYGAVGHFNAQIDETEDRAIRLVPPLSIRTPSADELEEWDPHSVIIAAGEIKTMSIYYLDSDEG